MANKGTIARVAEGSIAEELGLEPGDNLIAVNGNPVKDIIDLSFALAEEEVELLVEKANGEQEVMEIEKEYDEDLGIEFESAVFDHVRPCANRCIFCFVDQMPEGMRESLYIKDDDYRLSFLYGNFITLTNLGPQDFDRIKALHLTPLYVSVHTTDGEVRSRMLGNQRAASIMEQIKRLTEGGTAIHAQVVLCPGVNDGEVLEKTINDLYALYPAVMSLAIVPVGLTRYREGCHPLSAFTPEQAAGVIAAVAKWQQRCRQQNDESFVYLADEFYLAADKPIPEYELYDDFPQLENGVGIVRSFLAEWALNDFSGASYPEPCYLDVVCGVSAAKILEPLLAKLTIPNLTVRLVPVINKFFGENVTVTGLLTGQDILEKLKAMDGFRTGVIVPGVALRKGENIFLDNLTPADIAADLGIPVRAAYFAADLGELLKNWR